MTAADDVRRGHSSRRQRSRRRYESERSLGAENGMNKAAVGQPRGPSSEAHAPSRDVLAALDLGTNNCRLLIALPHRESFRVIDGFSRIVRLGQGVSASGYLADDAMDRTVEALKICAEKMARRQVTVSRVIATEACRRASNCDAFLDRVRHETGLKLEIITNKEEAELALAGCAPLLNPRVPDALVFDIGGGSTELVWLRRYRSRSRENRKYRSKLKVMSLPIGVVTLAEKYGGKEISGDTYRQMIDETAVRLREFDREHRIRERIDKKRVQMLGTSGTVTTLAGIHMELPQYIRDRVDGSFLDFDQAIGVAHRLAGMTYEDRVAHPCIGQERADLVVAGCAILEAMCEVWPVGRLRVADRGLREGMLFGLLNKSA